MRKLTIPSVTLHSRIMAGIPLDYIHPQEFDLVNELRNIADLDIYSSHYLKVTRDRYPEAIPILVKHLGINNDTGIVETIARSLICEEAKSIAFEPLLKFYTDRDINRFLTKEEIQQKGISYNRYEGMRGGVANALAYLAEKKDIEVLCNLLSDKNNGPSRTYFIEKIASSANKNNTQKIRKILQDVESENHANLSSFATRALKRKKFAL